VLVQETLERRAHVLVLFAALEQLSLHGEVCVEKLRTERSRAKVQVLEAISHNHAPVSPFAQPGLERSGNDPCCRVWPLADIRRQVYGAARLFGQG
jgi:hypothetical protein